MGVAKQLILQNTICFADSVIRSAVKQQLIDIEQNVLGHIDVIVGVIAEPYFEDCGFSILTDVTKQLIAL